MLEQLLTEINNWFLREIKPGEYTIDEGGGIALPFLKDGQYFRIVGSLYNDGLHQYPAEGLTPETFEGAIWALAVPPAVVSLADEIKTYQEKHGTPSPYTSESFGGYSYSKATKANGTAAGWREVYASQLNRWRRVGGIPYELIK